MLIKTTTRKRYINIIILMIITVDLEDVALVANDRANLEDIGCNADLYIANQEDVTQSEMFG